MPSAPLRCFPDLSAFGSRFGSCEKRQNAASLFEDINRKKFLIFYEIRNFLVETAGLEPVTSCVRRYDERRKALCRNAFRRFCALSVQWNVHCVRPILPGRFRVWVTVWVRRCIVKIIIAAFTTIVIFNYAVIYPVLFSLFIASSMRVSEYFSPLILITPCFTAETSFAFR